MVDITQPSIMGCAITPWFTALCLFSVGTIVFAILVVLGFSRRDLKERKMIENAVKNISNIPVKSIEMPATRFNTDSSDETVAIEDSDAGETETLNTEGFDLTTEDVKDETAGFDSTDESTADETEGFDSIDESTVDETAGFDSIYESVADETEGFGSIAERTDDKTEGFGSTIERTDDKTEGFGSTIESTDDKTEGFGLTIEGADDKTEGFNGDNGESVKRKSNFCSRCGNRVSGNFCSHCGHRID